MKALTVQQPWAWAIIHGTKRIENRTTNWSYRGPLAIHAGTRWSGRGARSALIHEALRPYGVTPDNGYPMGLPGLVRSGLFEEGKIIGIVDLIDVHRESIDLGSLERCCDSPWAEAEYVQADGAKRQYITHLVLDNPRPLAEPIVCKGRLGLWDTDAETTERLAAAP